MVAGELVTISSGCFRTLLEFRIPLFATKRHRIIRALDGRTIRMIKQFCNFPHACFSIFDSKVVVRGSAKLQSMGARRSCASSGARGLKFKALEGTHFARRG